MKPVSGEDIARAMEFFGPVNWQLSSPQEIRFGSKGSVAFNRDEQTYYDFEIEQGGHLDQLLPEIKPAPNCVELVVEKYDYVDEDGVLLYQQRRYEPKRFMPRAPDGQGGWREGHGCLDGIRRVPYCLPEILAADEVIVCEGEKDANAARALGLCATSKGAGSWDDMAHLLAGKRVYVVPDNDKGGATQARKAFDALVTVADSASYCEITKGMGDKADLADWLAVNDPATLMDVLHSFESRERVTASQFRAFEMAAVEPRKWLYGKHLIRGYVSATVSPGGVGKTTLELTDAIALATGRDLMGARVPERVRVWHYNLEDPRDELMRRVWAICRQFDIDPVELEGWLYLDSGRDCKMVVAEPMDGLVVATPAVGQVIAEMEKRDISVLQVDPLVKSHYAEENDNKQIDAVLDVFGDIAKRCGAAIDLVHHTRKPPQGFVAVAGDINTARGAGALAGAVRAARTVTPMSDKEADGFGIEHSRRAWYVRVDDAKGNMSAPAGEAIWFERHSIELGQGDYVGALAPWTPPDPFDGLGIDRCQRVLWAISNGLEDGQRYLLTNKSNSPRWAGQLLVNEGINVASARAVLKTWVGSKLLFMDNYHNPVRRKPEDGLFADMSKMPGKIDE